jgi:hypothetical protein
MSTVPDSSAARETSPEAAEPSEAIQVVDQKPGKVSPIARGALALRKRGAPMWAIYSLGWLLVIILWGLFALTLPESLRPIVNVAGCALLAIGGLTVAIAKSEPLYTGKHEGGAHTKWRSPIEDISYFVVLIGGLCVLVAAVKDPAFLKSWGDLVQGIGIVHGPQTPPCPNAP